MQALQCELYLCIWCVNIQQSTLHINNINLMRILRITHFVGILRILPYREHALHVVNGDGAISVEEEAAGGGAGGGGMEVIKLTLKIQLKLLKLLRWQGRHFRKQRANFNLRAVATATCVKFLQYLSLHSDAQALSDVDIAHGFHV